MPESVPLRHLRLSSTDFIRWLTAGAVLIVAAAAPPRLPATELTVAFWNVENLFDTVDDPDVTGDEEFTPESSKAWTETRLEIKLANLARVISDLNGGRGPDVLGLAEIENRAVVERLVRSLAKLERDFDIVHADSPSGRGIDCALIYDRKTLRLTGQTFHRYENLATRDTVEAVLAPAAGSGSFHVFVNHWPSRLNPAEERMQVARQLRARIDELLAADAAADFVLIGDLNDTPADPSVARGLRSWGDPDSLRPGVLFNSMWPVHRDGREGTYVFNNRWEVLDQVILSPGMLDQRGLSWERGSTQIVKRDYQLFVPRNPEQIPRPSRSYTGPNFHADGYSDHLPVSCRLKVHAD